jgi:hypothetical protein
MRSLKIIMFRDTDKPYTVILPSSLIVGVCFGVFALITLLSFSVMGNVMMVKQDSKYVTLAQDNATPAEQVADQQPVQAEEQQNESPEPAVETAEEIPEEATDAGETTTAEEILAEEPPVEELIQHEPAPYASYVADGSQVQAVIIGNIVNGNSQVTVRLRVEKLANRGALYSGYLVMALVDEDGNLGGAYPTRINTSGQEILNPQRGEPFRIRQSREVTAPINKRNGVQYQGVVIYIYDNETNELVWREMLEL